MDTHSPKTRSSSPSGSKNKEVRDSNWSKAARDSRNPLEKAQMVTPSPWRYDANVKTIQVSAPIAKFTKGPRFISNEFISKEHSKKQTVEENPGPGSYQGNIFELTDHGKHYTIAASRPSAKLYISRAHTTDAQGKDSPGPQYDTTAYTSQAFDRGPAYSFGLSDRSEMVKTDATIPAEATCRVERDTTTGKLHRTCLKCEGKSQKGVKKGERQPRISPGPGFYSPNIDTVVANPRKATIPTAARTLPSQCVISDTPSTQTYQPNYKSIRPASPKATFACNTLSERVADRFEIVSYKGKGIGERPGRESPGPMYKPPVETHAPAYTIATRERTITKPLLPCPTRARLLSGELAKENIGMFGPGPKYNPSEAWTKHHAPSYSFGTTDREFVELSEQHKNNIGNQRSPADVRYISPQHSRCYIGSISPGPASKLNPNFDALSTTMRPPKAVIGGPSVPKKPLNSVDHEGSLSGSLRRSQSSKEKDKPAPLALYPNLDAVRQSGPKFSVPLGKRETLGVKAGVSTGPGAGEYRPNYHAVETHKPAAGFGGLGARVPSLPKKLKVV